MKLFNNLKSIFSSKEKQFSIHETTPDELLKINFKQIQSREEDGMIIRNFISADICKLLVKNLKKENKNYHSLHDPIFPSSFAQIDRNSENFKDEMASCFLDSSSFIDNFSSVYEFDLPKKISAIFSKLNPDKEHRMAHGFDNKGCYVPGTFRVQHPDNVTINLHCGNQFIQMFPKYYEHLSSKVDVMDQLSYFIMLQEPDEGGRLILYDVSWNDAQDCDTVTNSIIMLDGKTIPLDVSSAIKSSTLEIRNGDLLIFSGGQIWHSVEQVRGNTERVTFGGFIGFGSSPTNNNRFYLWS